MQRIEITAAIQKIALDYKIEVIQTYGLSISKQLKKLRSIISRGALPYRTKLDSYIRYLNKNISDILTLLPSQFDSYEKNNFFVLSDAELDTPILIGKTTKKFHEWITTYLHYDDVRRHIYPKYLERIKINTCVYCNADFISSCHLQKTDSTGNLVFDRNGNPEYDCKGRFQLDHFWPKSKHPFLSISFFNLQPSCNSCNLWKSDEDIPFNLFTDGNEPRSPFRFKILWRDVTKYALSHDKDDLNIDFTSSINNYDRFHIKEVYKPFKDEVEELLWKKLTIDEAYISLLQSSLPSLITDNNDYLHRYFYGFYKSPNDILRRPLSKMKQDLAVQFENMAKKQKIKL